MNYRPEIDGLRAVAVLAVIFYHAELLLFDRYYFGGGFVGVDVFFVISGYLISRIILAEIFDTGHFDFKNFYVRRVRRILPMLLTVMLVSIPFAWSILQPSAFVEYSQSLLSGLFFFANFFFYHVTAAYGAESSLLKPFLHSWSLSIEEQFYFVFPVILCVTYRLIGRFTPMVIALMFLVSLQYSSIQYGDNVSLNFYHPLSRFWELLAGSIVAYTELRYGRVQNNWLCHVLPAVGLWGIAYGFLFFDDQFTTHPGYITLIPVLGTLAILAFSSPKDFVGWILSSKLFVGIGLISYSAYLWHFPIMAFARLYMPEITQYQMIGMIVLSLSLSVVSYYVIERPFRLVAFGLRGTHLFIFCAAVLVFTFSCFGLSSDGFKQLRFGYASNYEFDNAALRKKSWTYVRKQSFSYPENEKKNVLFVGNSHSKDLFNAMYLNKEFKKDLNL